MKIFDRIKSFSVTVIPQSPGVRLRPFRMGPGKTMFLSVILITVFCLSACFLLSLSNQRFSAFGSDDQNLLREKAKVEALEKKINSLASQMDKLSRKNKQLALAMLLGEGRLDTNSAQYKSLQQNYSDGNSVLFAFERLFLIGKSEPRFFLRPCDGYIIKKFNERSGHFGVDYSLNDKSLVYASSSGGVIFSDYSNEGGNSVIIRHPDDFITVYKHLRLSFVKVGQRIKTGELIGLGGSSGENSTGPHLHFELWHRGSPVNPEKFIK